MNDALKFCYETRCVASIYRNPDEPERHLTGFVERYNDTEVLVSHITPYGMYDGFILLLRDDIFRIDRNGKYENKISRLYKLRDQSHPVVNTFQEDRNLLDTMLDFAMKNSYVVSVSDGDGYDIGNLISYDDQYLTLDTYDSYGEYNGRVTVMIDNIVALSVDNEEAAAIKLLQN